MRQDVSKETSSKELPYKIFSKFLLQYSLEYERISIADVFEHSGPLNSISLQDSPNISPHHPYAYEYERVKEEIRRSRFVI